MTVCLVLQGDSASPGAREKMCSGFRCWRKSMPSTHAGGWRGRGHLRLPEASPLGLQRPCQVQGSGGQAWAGRGRAVQRQTLGDWACAWPSLPAHAFFPCPHFKVGHEGITPGRGCVFSSLSSNLSNKDFYTCLFPTTGDRQPLCKLLGKKEATFCQSLFLRVPPATEPLTHSLSCTVLLEGICRLAGRLG